jgi:hypothetical protein
VISSAVIELHLEYFEEFLPKLGCENVVSVTDYFGGRTMQLEDIIHKQFCYLLGSKRMAESEEMCIFGQSVDYDQDDIQSLRFWEASNEIHAQIRPFCCRNGQWV